MPDHVVLRRATGGDLRFLSDLASDPSVEPFLMPGASEQHVLRALADEESLFVIESPKGDRVGGLALQVFSRHSGICELTRLMVRPDRRRAGIASAAVALVCQDAVADLGMHRIQAEVYGDNLASQKLFEQVGFAREGTRRRAYWRRGGWLDGVMYGLLAEELKAQQEARLWRHPRTSPEGDQTGSDIDQL